MTSVAVGGYGPTAAMALGTRRSSGPSVVVATDLGTTSWASPPPPGLSTRLVVVVVTASLVSVATILSVVAEFLA